MSKKREVKNSFYCGIPMSFLFSNNYAYFESLADTEDNGPLVAQYKQKLYSQAVRQANKAAKTISTGSEKVNQAVAFLGVAAESERNKGSFVKAKAEDFIASYKQFMEDVKDCDRNDENDKKYMNFLFDSYVIKGGIVSETC